MASEYQGRAATRTRYKAAYRQANKVTSRVGIDPLSPRQARSAWLPPALPVRAARAELDPRQDADDHE